MVIWMDILSEVLYEITVFRVGLNMALMAVIRLNQYGFRNQSGSHIDKSSKHVLVYFLCVLHQLEMFCVHICIIHTSIREREIFLGIVKCITQVLLMI